MLILALSPPIAADKLLGALLAYRVIYSFIPLGIGIMLFVTYEFNQRRTASNRLPGEG